jgi:hypothetical protein
VTRPYRSSSARNRKAYDALLWSFAFGRHVQGICQSCGLARRVLHQQEHRSLSASYDSVELNSFICICLSWPWRASFFAPYIGILFRAWVVSDMKQYLDTERDDNWCCVVCWVCGAWADIGGASLHLLVIVCLQRAAHRTRCVCWPIRLLSCDRVHEKQSACFKCECIVFELMRVGIWLECHHLDCDADRLLLQTASIARHQHITYTRAKETWTHGSHH